MAEATTNATRPRGFAGELADGWRRLPDKGLFLALAGAWLLLFHFLGNSTFGYVDTPSLFRWLYNAYNGRNTDDGHGNLIPFAVALLFWMKRGELLALPRRNWWPGLVILSGATLLHVTGYIVQQPRLSVVALFAGLYGLMGMVWGPAWLRGSFFPFVLFAFSIPLGSLAESVTFPLRMLVTKIAVSVSNDLLGIQVVRDGSRIFDVRQSFQYDVAPACSGIRSLIALAAVAVIYSFVTFRSSWRRVAIIAAAAPLAVLGNVARLVVVILVADAFGEKAGAAVEQKFGFVTFAVALGGVLLLGWLLREKKPAAQEKNLAEEKTSPPENQTA
ncbi:MAG: exosortase/archaeosortase family protein [Verrucomicrobia bacterium]|nr:exosortase/archaeosortase family protein [Verrucomicrobiota bacterium]